MMSDSTSILKPLLSMLLDLASATGRFSANHGYFAICFARLMSLVVQRDLDVVTQTAAVVVLRPNADELRIGNRHALTLEGEVDRALLDHRVDVVPPRVAIEQAVDRQPELLVQAVQQAAHAARGLPGALGEDAVVLPSQKRSSLKRLQTVSFSTCRTKSASHFLNWMTSRLDDRRNRVAAGAHAPAVDLVAVVDERDVADHRPTLLREDVQLFAETVRA